MNFENDDDSNVYESNNDGRSVGNDSEEENPIARMSRQFVGNIYVARSYGKPYLCNVLIFDNAIKYRKVLSDYAIEEGLNYVRSIKKLNHMMKTYLY